MKSKDVARSYGIDHTAFVNWLKQIGVVHKAGMMGGVEIDGTENVDGLVTNFKQYQEQEQERIGRENADRERAEQKKQTALSSLLITSGFSFEGYTITKYSGYISGDDAVQIDRGTAGWLTQATDVGASLMASLVHIRRNALTELKEAAHALGCNAVIGVDFDYLTLEPETASSGGGTMYLPYVFGVTANGNAVIVEKNDRTGLADRGPEPLHDHQPLHKSEADDDQVVAGWYDDGSGRQRWWDGSDWTDQFQ